MTDITLDCVADLLDTSADAIVVATYADALSPAAMRVDAALDGLLTEMRSGHEHRGRFGDVAVVPTLGRLTARRVVVIGLGDPAKLDSFRLHNAYQFVGAALRKRRLTTVVTDIDTLVITAVGDTALAVRAAVTGILLGNVDDVHVGDSGVAPLIASVRVAGVADNAATAAALIDSRALADATNRTRLWAKLPGNQWTPTVFAARVAELCDGTGITVETLDAAELRRIGAGALLGVSAGSVEPPVMITLRWSGADAAAPVLGLVGKGVTFDTGGISIKPALQMELMKYDMSGAAAVVNAMLAIAALNVRANVVAVVPSTENMPSGSATKPGDVLSALDGQTIEVINTDAEGRLILADGLVKARQMGATHLVDVATLTGAAIIALGHPTSALMTNNPALAGDVERAAELGGDRVAELPMHPEYDVCLSSDVADVKNWGGREAGAIAAAVFLRAFVDGVPWVHLDIAGSAWNDQGSMTQIPKGPTGSPVRTLVQLARLFGERHTG